MSNVRYAAQAVWQLKAMLCIFLAGPALAEKESDYAARLAEGGTSLYGIRL